MPTLPIDVSTYTLPAFALLIVVELISFWMHRRDDEQGYAWKDTITNFAMLSGNVVTQMLFKIPIVGLYTLLYELTPLRIPLVLWSLPILFVVHDFLSYWAHRSHHTIRVLWAEHVVHHSSRRFNMSTATRLSWTDLVNPLFFLPMIALGVHPATVLFCSALNLAYQFPLHTERVRRLPAAIETVFNTPSHHRVHHASQGGYLDRNFGGILIVWDRMFGTFAAEDDSKPCRYGLTENIDTHNPLRVATHEYAAIGRDLTTARTWRERAGYVFGRPGWTPTAPRRPQLASAGAAPRDGDLCDGRGNGA